MRQQVLLIKDIVFKEELYPREKVNQKVVREYVTDMKKGALFPNIYVAKFKGKYYLVDGKHRVEAYSILGDAHVQSDVKDNFKNFDDIYLAAFRANDKHGCRLNREDRLKVAVKLVEVYKRDIDDVSKLTRIQVYSIDSIISSKVKKLVIGDKIRSKQLPKVFREKVKREEELKIETLEVNETKEMRLKRKIDNQIYELRQILDFFKDTELYIDSVKVENLVRNIKRVLKKKYSKL